ncbi:cation:proton antiporter [Nitrosopumilus sp.]|uniref:cation:proton antiporter n=1 Tax=Nitrosopumilus sp. TaxID=2024843 RepID=UPI003D09CD0F
MDLTEIFFAIVILLAGAKILGELFRKLKQPSLGGEILAGIILGPTLFGIVQISDGLELISTIAIFFVMLFIGLEMNLSEIRKTGKYALLISITSLIIPFFIGYQLSVVFGLELIESLFIGLLLSVTSVPVSAMILRELGILKTKIGTTVISVAIIDDIISLIILAIILQLHAADHASFNFEELGISIFQISVYLIGITFLAFIVYRIDNWFPKRFELFFEKAKTHEAKFGIFIVVAITLSLIADLVGLHFILGAFFAGLIFSKKILGNKESDKTYGTMSGMTFGFIAPLFFAIIGIKFSAQSLENYIPFLILLVILGIFGKTFGGFLGTKISKFSNMQGFAISALLNGRGTVGLTITAVAYALGILDIVLFSVCVLICVITTMVTPVIAKPFLKKI